MNGKEDTKISVAQPRARMYTLTPGTKEKIGPANQPISLAYLDSPSVLQ